MSDIDKKDQTKIETKKVKIPPKSKDEFWAKEFSGVKEQNAVDILLREKQGHVKGAFNIPGLPRNGDIDLVWGDKTGGLEHLMSKRDFYKANGTGKISGLEMANKITEIMTKGKLGLDKHNRHYVEYDGFRVGININYFDDEATWIVTAMEVFD